MLSGRGARTSDGDADGASDRDDPTTYAPDVPSDVAAATTAAPEATAVPLPSTYVRQ